MRRDAADLETLDQLYSRFAARYNGTLKRTMEWWKESVLDQDMHHGLFISEAGEPEGYVLYKMMNRELVIDEFVYLNEKARRGLWTFLANHDSMVTGALLKLVPSDDILPFLLPDPRIPRRIIHILWRGLLMHRPSLIPLFSINSRKPGNIRCPLKMSMLHGTTEAGS